MCGTKRKSEREDSNSNMRETRAVPCSVLSARDRLCGDASVAKAGSVHGAKDLRAKASVSRSAQYTRTHARTSNYLPSCQVELNNDVVVSGGASGNGAQQIATRGALPKRREGVGRGA